MSMSSFHSTPDIVSNLNKVRSQGERAVYGNDDGLFVEFSREPFLNEFKTEKEGREVWDERDIITICKPGAKSEVMRYVKLKDDAWGQADPKRFPRQWERFQARQEQTQEGLPIEECPFIGKAKVMELKAQKVHTVEQLAMMPDAMTQEIGMGGLELRNKARAFLDDATRMAAVAEKDAENNLLRSELETLKRQMADLTALRSNAA